MSDKASDLPFALMAWIKRNQEDIEAHRVKMVAKTWKDDCEQYMGFIGVVVGHWSKLKIKDRQFLMNLVSWHNQHRNFTPGQRSAIASMYMKFNYPKEK